MSASIDTTWRPEEDARLQRLLLAGKSFAGCGAVA